VLIVGKIKLHKGYVMSGGIKVV